MFLVLCGLVPKLGALVSIMPQAVLGGAAVMMFSSIVISSIQLITKEKMTARNLTIVSVALGVGYGMGATPQYPGTVPAVCSAYLRRVRHCSCGCCWRILLNLLLPKEKN